MESNMHQEPTLSVWVYLPSGLKVNFSSPTYADGKEAARHAIEWTNDLLAAGAMIALPGLEAGEEKETIGWIVQRQAGDGVPMIDLYSSNDQLKFPWIKAYLNNDDEIALFEHATGLKLSAIPLYDGENHLERGKSADKDSRYVVPVRNVVTAYKKLNPRYNPDEQDIKKRKPRYLFSGFEGLRNASTQESSESSHQSAGSQPASAQAEPPWNPDTIKSLTKKYGVENLKAALGFTAENKWSDWTKGWQAAVDAAEEYSKEMAF